MLDSRYEVYYSYGLQLWEVYDSVADVVIWRDDSYNDTKQVAALAEELCERPKDWQIALRLFNYHKSKEHESY